MPQLVHVGTTITVTFGQLTEAGDILTPTAFEWSLQVLDDLAFAQVRHLIDQKRAELIASLPVEPTPAGPTLEPG